MFYHIDNIEHSHRTHSPPLLAMYLCVFPDVFYVVKKTAHLFFAFTKKALLKKGVGHFALNKDRYFNFN